MPEAEYTWLPREDILDFEETARLVRLFVRLGVDRVRLTGGEPLLRRDLPVLVRMLAQIDGIRDLALTTNGVLLADQADSLRDAGLQRITVSLDTLSRETFTRLTRADELARVRDGLAAAARVFPGFKIDTVLVRGVNERRDRRTGGRGKRARRRAAVHRVHGRGRRHALDAESGDRARRDISRRLRAAAPSRALPAGTLGSGASLRAAWRPGRRDHRVDHLTFLPDLRPKPFDRRRRVVPVSLRAVRA